jgi:glycyl-tRNA synthetase
LDGYGKEKLKEVIVKYNVKAPETGNDVIDLNNMFKLSDPEPFNLMLPTIVGPSTKVPSYLRPETA